ncbi:BZ3500_MvSof-1268-A1-R1_Chr7-1g09406 [Microbotryum saponariae]|uniref:BZ3500_MvSof-1268-A1-R1_Chr7-1g09406 protein n=1 Tax=Microbotryum saponariae TaxID=289078 RepID=A0A2X0LCD1_9BASI|nr:BZ3501_MvSof-1269-A2-R1_Chr7-1g09111 [Microbotryum saponariae]SDA03379.1 BZ3500_MvSof-1268-A1-R1_Chr7-1g09406 [Microbotryum saponariae]
MSCSVARRVLLSLSPRHRAWHTPSLSTKHSFCLPLACFIPVSIELRRGVASDCPCTRSRSCFHDYENAATLVHHTMSYDRAYDHRRGDGPPPPDHYYGSAPPWSRGSSGGPHDPRMGPPPTHLGGGPGPYRRSPPPPMGLSIGIGIGMGMSARDDRYGEPEEWPGYPGGGPSGYDDRQGGSKRRRGPSPSGYRDHHGATSRSEPPIRSTLEAPETLPYQVTQRYFTDWLLQNKPSLSKNQPAIEAEWSKYLTSWRRKALTSTFQEHEKAAWFREKYDPREPYAEMRERLKQKGREGRVESFLAELARDHLEGIVMDYGEWKPRTLFRSFNTDGTNAEEQNSSFKADDGESRKIHADQTLVAGSPTALVLKTIKSNISRTQLEERLASLEGFLYLALTDPIPDKKFHRVGFANFATTEQTEAGLAALKDWSIDGFHLPIARADKPLSMRYRATPALMNEPSRIAKDLEQIQRLALALERDAGDSRGSVAIEQRLKKWNEEGGIAMEADSTKKALDLYLHYLRTAFHTCYYCLAVFNFGEELLRRCPKHVRLVSEGKKPISGSQCFMSGAQAQTLMLSLFMLPILVAAELTWVRSFDDRLALLTDRDTVNLAELGGDDPEEAMHTLCATLHKTEGEGKYRCQQCNKLFSALKFVEKHITTKHPDDIRDKFDKVGINFFNNYVLDPLHFPQPEKLDNFTPTALKEFDHITPKQSMNKSNHNKTNGTIPGGGAAPSLLTERLGPMATNPSEPKRRRQDSLPMGQRLQPPPPPVGVRMDPRAERGQRSYADLDGPAGGTADEVVLQY